MEYPTLETVSIRGENHSVFIDLNNPPVNALSKQLISELNLVCDWIYRQASIQLVVFSGKGKHFCAGADLKERQLMHDREVKAFVKTLSDTFWRISTIPVPTLAAINGSCLGGGLELALSCDFRIMVDRGFIGLTETSLGIIPGGGGTQRLPRLIGPSLAKYWIFSAQSFTPDEAFEDGVIDWIVGEESFQEAVNDFCNLITSNSPLALKAAKQAIIEGMELSLKDGLEAEQRAYHTIISTEDRKEALKAFMEKRTPKWKGK